VILVHITALAERDLEDIWLTIAPNNPRAATRLLRAIGRKIDLLADFPRLGTRRPDIRTRMRMMVARPYLVLYAIHPDADDQAVETVEIVRVVDARRDLRRLF
jgi:toxin ParE1/3/4